MREDRRFESDDRTPLMERLSDLGSENRFDHGVSVAGFTYRARISTPPRHGGCPGTGRGRSPTRAGSRPPPEAPRHGPSTPGRTRPTRQRRAGSAITTSGAGASGEARHAPTSEVTTSISVGGGSRRGRLIRASAVADRE